MGLMCHKGSYLSSMETASMESTALIDTFLLYWKFLFSYSKKSKMPRL